MKQILYVALDEWRYWSRSHLAMSAVLIFLALIITSSVLTAAHLQEQNHTRTHQQTEAEDTFLSQPDRHPHRMVHYGHYVFRAAAPLAIFDPGLDAIVGQSIFLEGHRQNSVMFAESASSTNLGDLPWLSPALIYQLFAPLVLILLGHSAMVREREAAALAPLLALGITGRTLVMGKVLALLCFTLLMLCPLLLSGIWALSSGARVMALLSLLGVYSAYLAIWVALTLLVSTLLNKRSTILATMTGLWFCLTLALPSIAVNFVAEPMAGKIETDLKMLSDLRKLGDGHNANDPAFVALRKTLLEKHQVDRIEDLPVNYRGLVAMDAEEKLSKVLNDYANKRMNAEQQQEQHLARYGLSLIHI